MNNATDWTSAVAILVGGLILGLLVVYFFSRRKAAPRFGGDADLALKDLQAKRDVLIQQLRELDSDAKLTPTQIAAERARLERETADVLRAIDGHRPAATAAEGSSPVAASPMSPALQGVLWGAGSFCLLAVLAYFVMKQSTPRVEQPGPMQAAPAAAAQQPAQTNPVVAQLEAAVQKDPENLQLRNDLAQAYLEVENLMGVFEQTKVVLAKQPDDSRALAFQGLVRLAMGEADVAVKMLEHATKSDGKNLDAWVGLAWVYTQTGKTKEADAAIASAIQVSPENRARLEDVLRQMKGQPSALSPQQQASGELPAGHPAIGDAAPAAAAPASASTSQASIRITIDIDPAARSRMNPNGVLFVIAKGAPGAPPVAVKRVAASSLPTTIELSSADSMMGQPLPALVRIEARLDSDGDALTKPATDPAASMDGVAIGSSIRLALK
jgi:cytochrome c-type biogenesis protein CcmH